LSAPISQNSVLGQIEAQLSMLLNRVSALLSQLGGGTTQSDPPSGSALTDLTNVGGQGSGGHHHSMAGDPNQSASGSGAHYLDSQPSSNLSHYRHDGNNQQG